MSSLESLLLFQALRSDGVGSTSFHTISNELKSIPLIRNDATYDSGRLSPDALRELYLGLLKDEVKRDLERECEKDNNPQNGSLSPNSRKRKLASPKLPTVHDASQHSHLIPQLVLRLYSRYRENAVREIREQERRYENLQREVREIEAGEWDERLNRQQVARKTQSPKPSTAAHTHNVIARQDHAPDNASASPVPQQRAGDIQPLRYSTAKIDAVINHGPEPEPGHGGHRRTLSNTTLPPLSEMAPQSPRFGIPPTIPLPQARGYHPSPPSSHQSAYPHSHSHPPSHAAASPQIHSRPSSSHRPLLPPPKGMQLPPPPHVGSPGLRGPSPMPQQQSYPQPQPYTLPQPVLEQMQRKAPQHVQQQAPHVPALQGYYNPVQDPLYQDRRSSYPPPPSQQQPPVYSQPQQYPNHSLPARQGGYMLPPFQVSPQEPTMVQQQQQVAPPSQQKFEGRPQSRPQYGTPQPQRTALYSTAYPHAPGSAPQPRADPKMANILSALGTPKAKPSPSSLWKHDGFPTPLQVPPRSPTRPLAEPLSPNKNRAMSRPKQTAHSQRGRPAKTPTGQKREREHQRDPSPQRKSKPQRGNRRQARKPRGNSVTSSAPPCSTRSQSVSSAMSPDERPASKQSTVKDEPATPAGINEEHDETAEPEQTPVSSIGVTTRKRRATLQSQQSVSKRKRQHSPPATVDNTPAAERSPSLPPERPKTISATHNFHKMANVLLADIQSHKHGSRFAAPVREKDAEGYTDIIKRPTDLKTIKAAVAAGNRAVIAATANIDQSPSASGTPSAVASRDTSTVILARSADLMPPKAIVNSAQLEREIMRMLANAVMFNPGEDGLVADAREMFEDVEAKIRDWRGAETAREVREEDDSAGNGKKRKL